MRGRDGRAAPSERFRPLVAEPYASVDEGPPSRLSLSMASMAAGLSSGFATDDRVNEARLGAVVPQCTCDEVGVRCVPVGACGASPSGRDGFVCLEMRYSPHARRISRRGKRTFADGRRPGQRPSGLGRQLREDTFALARVAVSE